VLGDAWLYELNGKEVAFTGRNPGYQEKDLARLCREHGARRVSDDLNCTTDVLVRGHSARWKYGNYGKKENRAARLQAQGHDIVIIDLQGLLALAEGLPAPVLTPNVPGARARGPASEGGAFGAPYQTGQFAKPVQGDGVAYRDPEKQSRGLRGHGLTADRFAEFLDLIGYAPLRAFDRECNFDVGWSDNDGRHCLAEIKSLTEANETDQIRHGLGQVLDYALRLERRGFCPRPYVVLERQPSNEHHWRALCQRHGVQLTWAPEFPNLMS
jgi:hypothetical protein